MKRLYSVLAVLNLFAITGCRDLALSPESEPKQIATEKIVFQSWQDVSCLAMPVNSDKKNFSVPMPARNQWLQLPSGETPFIAYQLVEGSYEVKVSSQIIAGERRGEAEVFMPEVALLDENHNVVKILDKNQARYQKTGFVASEGIVTRFNIDPYLGQKYACMVVYTTDAARSETTLLANEAKEYAKVHGVVPPPVPDTYARHGNTGRLDISVKGNKTNIIAAPLVISGATTLSVDDNFTQSMRTHYLEGSKQALSDKNTARALELRNELKEVVANTEQYFASQYGKRGNALIMPTAPLPESAFVEKAIYHYQTSVGQALEAGKASSALQQIDGLKNLQSEIDRLFNF